MKRFLLLLFAASLVLCACENTNTIPATITHPAATKTNKPAATATIKAVNQFDALKDSLKGQTIDVWYPWFGVEAKLFESLVEKFNETNEWGIVIQPTSQGNFNNLFENVGISLPRSNRPDIAIALPEHALAWDADGAVVDMTLFATDSSYGVDAKDFNDVFFERDEIDGRRIAMPAQGTARFMLWNKTWARDLGFNSQPKSSGNFLQQACRANKAMLTDADANNDGMGGWLVDTSWQTTLSWMTAFGGGPLEQNDYRFLTPNNIAAFKFTREIAEKGCAFQLAPDADIYAAFANRQALFSAISLGEFPNQARAFSEANNDDEWIPIAFPGDGKSGLIVYGSSYVILKSNAKEEFASWLFIRWMLDPEQDARMAETTNLFPLRLSTLDLLASYEKSHPQWAEALKLLPDASSQPKLASWRAVKVMIGDGFDHMFRVNTPSGRVAEILVMMESTSREISK